MNEIKLNPKGDLEQRIRESYSLIRKYEQIIQYESDPKTIQRAKKDASEQWKLINEYLRKYRALAGNAWPPDITEIARLASAQSKTPPPPPPAPKPYRNKPAWLAWFKSLPAAQQVALIGVIATIVAALIGLVGTLGVPLIQEWLSNTPPPQNTTTPYSYPVIVEDATTRAPIVGAMVTIIVGNLAPIDDYTDSKGFAQLRIPASYMGKAGTLIVEKDGYQKWEQEIDFLPNIPPKTIKLKPH